MKTKQLLLLLLLVPFITFGQWNQIGADIDGEAADDQSGAAVSLSSDGSILAIGANENDGNGLDSGHVRVYENQGGVWIQIGEDINGESIDDNSGRSISLSSDGSIVAIGAWENDGNGVNRGHVRVYENQGGIWIQIGADIDGEIDNDNSGKAVSLSSDGSVVAIGANWNDGNGSYSGHVRVYENQGGVWNQIGTDINGETNLDYSGTALSLSSDGSLVAIGANGNDGNGNNSGHVRIYENQGGVWTQVGADIDGEAINDNSGVAVCLSSDGSIVAIGAYGNDENGEESGQVRVYENIGGSWMQIGSDIDGEAIYDQSGSAVSLSADGSVVAIGALNNDGTADESGHVRVYENQGGVWTQVGADIDGEAIDDSSGIAVSLSSDGSMLAIGAVRNSGNGVDSGHVRVYQNTLLSVEENIFSSKFNLYPNPINNTLHIEANNNIELVEIYNLLGQQILSTTPNTLTEEINMSGFNSGMYLVKVKIGEQTATYKVVKE